eukprot:3389057-Rhodomonas_salina.1
MLRALGQRTRSARHSGSAPTFRCPSHERRFRVVPEATLPCEGSQRWRTRAAACRPCSPVRACQFRGLSSA